MGASNSIIVLDPVEVVEVLKKIPRIISIKNGSDM